MRFLLIAIALVGFRAAPAGDPPELVNYQGVLRDAAGSSVPDGAYDMIFRFYGHTVLGPEALIDAHLAANTGAVTVTGGLFNVALGSGAVSDGAGPGTFTSLGQLFRSLDEVYLEMEVSGEVLSPRIRVLSAAYSLGHRVADPPCFDDELRLVDCGNGTVTDGVTGLIWLKDASCLGTGSWAEANALVGSLGDGTHPDCNLTDGSKPGDWRLPTLGCPAPNTVCNLADALGEFATIFAPSCPLPNILDSTGLACWSENDPFVGVQSYFHWSSSARPDNPRYGWFADLSWPDVNSFFKGADFFIWPVRDGR